jgi:DNA-binding transcriptional LysR family regulator
MDLWQLHIFVSVVENKSFSKASEMINLSQPTVSSHIKELESYFQCRLLDRLGKITEPTRAGAILYQYAKQILSLKERAETSLFDFLGTSKGQLIVGGSTIPSGYIIPRMIGSFSKAYPGIKIELKSGDTRQIVSSIAKGKIEVGIVGARVNDPMVVQEKLIADQMKLIVPKGHPWAGKKAVECARLSTENIITREKGSGTWQSIMDSMNRFGFSPADLNASVTMGNTTSVIQGILNGVGISILSTIAVKDELQKGRLFALSVKGLDLDRYFYLTYAKKRTLSPICKKFVTFMRQDL